MEKEQISFTFIEIDENNQNVTVRPYSTKFKNPPEHYPEFNISISSLDPNKELDTQIGTLMEPIIESIINKEKSSYLSMIDKIKDKLNKQIDIDKQKIKNYIKRIDEQKEEKNLDIKFL